MTGTDIVPKATIVELCGARDRALAAFGDAAERIAAANRAAHTVATAPGERYISTPTLELSCGYGRGRNITAEEYRRELDAGFWTFVMHKSGLGDLMGAKQKEDWRERLQKDPPAFEMATVIATFDNLRASAGDIFSQSIVDVFERLDRDFRSHDGFKIGARVVQTYAVSCWMGRYSWRRAGRRDACDHLDDLDRAMHRLDGKPQTANISHAAAAAMSRGETTFTGDYFRLRWFQNGNLHVWMLREDLVREANRILARHYGPRLAWQHLHPDERRKRENAAA